MWPSEQMLRSPAAPALLPLLLLAAFPASLQAAAAPPAAETLACATPAAAPAQPSPADLSASPGRGHARSRGLAEQQQQQAKRATAAASPMEIPPSHFPATRASGVVGNYINYQHGGPNKIFEVRQVSQASREVSQQHLPGRGGREGGRGPGRIQNPEPQAEGGGR